MSLSFASINSGSNGNCYYVGNDSEAVLVDVGINCKEVEKRMKRLKLDMQKIKAIFISHEHSDHIIGTAVLAKKYNLPVYISAGTLTRSNFGLKRISTHQIFDGIAVSIGGLQIIPFTKEHDASDPMSFTIQYNGYSVGIITDIGIICENVKKHFSEYDAVFLESNYDTDMLINGRYPLYLKRRITGGKGHISNAQALDLFVNHRSDKLKYLILSHLSKENNNPDLVYALFSEHTINTRIVVASRYEETSVFKISNETNYSVQQTVEVNVQMKLF
jgi:phosphoribosyl 1,2-cyclic phosphodiesterase